MNTSSASALHFLTVTHNYAPTATSKTMVDGQGFVTKSLYRKLERSEEEGTRCPTTYDLFKLFTSRYPITPTEIDDEKICLMTVTRRYQRFLVDIADATPEKILRAEVEHPSHEPHPIKNKRLRKIKF